MTLEEIKQQKPMPEMVRSYGLQPNRAGFIKCPFHSGDNTASMKIYKDSFYCYGCGASGDVFAFVMRMDNCDFKTAFYSLGGTYQKPSKASEIANYRREMARQKELRRKEKIKSQLELNNMLIGIYLTYAKKSPPMSDTWCDCINELTTCFGRDEYLRKELEGGGTNGTVSQI